MTSTEKLRVLLVEDTMLVADQLREIVHQSLRDPDVLVACTEDEAVATVNIYEPHVVILDLKLKQGTGFGVLRTLSTVEDRPLLIVLTNYALPQYREFATLIGADFFLDKAFDFSTLAHILKSIPYAEGGKPTLTKH